MILIANSACLEWDRKSSVHVAHMQRKESKKEESIQVRISPRQFTQHQQQPLPIKSNNPVHVKKKNRRKKAFKSESPRQFTQHQQQPLPLPATYHRPPDNDFLDPRHLILVPTIASQHLQMNSNQCFHTYWDLFVSN
jgi:hypothetical protein